MDMVIFEENVSQVSPNCTMLSHALCSLPLMMNQGEKSCKQRPRYTEGESVFTVSLRALA